MTASHPEKSPILNSWAQRQSSLAILKNNGPVHIFLEIYFLSLVHIVHDDPAPGKENVVMDINIRPALNLKRTILMNVETKALQVPLGGRDRSKWDVEIIQTSKHVVSMRNRLLLFKQSKSGLPYLIQGEVHIGVQFRDMQEKGWFVLSLNLSSRFALGLQELR